MAIMAVHALAISSTSAGINKYATLSELAAETHAFLNEGTSCVVGSKEPNTEVQNISSGDEFFEGFPSKKEFCQDLEKRGLLDLLCACEPEDIGFIFSWYRHSLRR